MELFGGQLTLENGLVELPRYNFDSFWWAFLTVFQILTLEDWNLIMYDCVQVTSYWNIAYFIVLVVVGNFMVLNLFIAVLLTAMSSKHTAPDAALAAEPGDSDQDAGQTGEEPVTPTLVHFQKRMTEWDSQKSTAGTSSSHKEKHGKSKEDEGSWEGRDRGMSKTERSKMKAVQRHSQYIDGLKQMMDHPSSDSELEKGKGSKRSGAASDPSTSQKSSPSHKKTRHTARSDSKGKLSLHSGAAGLLYGELQGSSLGCMPKTFFLRREIFALIDDNRFDSLVMLCICVSSVVLALEPGYEGTQLFAGLELLFLSLFTLE
eukprot:gene17460-20787_t